MIELAVWRETRCPGCGGDLAETTDPANDDRYQAEAIRCHKCTAIAQSAGRYTGKNVTAPNAILHRAQLRT